MKFFTNFFAYLDNIVVGMFIYIHVSDVRVQYVQPVHRWQIALSREDINLALFRRTIFANEFNPFLIRWLVQLLNYETLSELCWRNYFVAINRVHHIDSLSSLTGMNNFTFIAVIGWLSCEFKCILFKGGRKYNLLISNQSDTRHIRLCLPWISFTSVNDIMLKLPLTFSDNLIEVSGKSRWYNMPDIYYLFFC